MRDIPPSSDILCVDSGTTNTRLWRVTRRGEVLCRLTAHVGVRDSAREGSSHSLRNKLRDLIQEADQSGSPPACVVAAGMITSSLGLLDVPHIAAPAGLRELAAAAKLHAFPDVTPLPVLLVPGLYSGTSPAAAHAPAPDGDIMRGEETLCVGLHALGLASRAATVLNLGSHWKAIQLDDTGRILSSLTALTGEMIHTIATQTILAGALPAERPDALNPDWLTRGMRDQRADGLSRTLFRVRLHQLAARSTPQERMAYTIGAFIAADMDSLVTAGKIRKQSPVLLAGNTALATAWTLALEQSGIGGTVLGEETVERATFLGLLGILEAKDATP